MCIIWGRGCVFYASDFMTSAHYYKTVSLSLEQVIFRGQNIKKNCQRDQYDDNDMINMELMLPEIITFGNQCFGVIQSEKKT